MLVLAQALASQPSVMVVDELSLGLAPVVIRQLYATRPRIAESGTTIVLVEQDVGQALKAADRAYCLLEGRVSLHGRASELEHDRVVSAYFGV
jgi:branched-chain amino acid transport system ATP-binding protein